MTVAAKRIRVSDDSGSTLYTLPGNTGNIQRDGGTVDDTIFGQNFKSMQTTLIDAKITSNALYRGFAGYLATIKKSGSSTATTGEATTQIGSSKSYQITNPVKQIFDRTVVPLVKDAGVDHTPDVLSYDYLFGIVTFKSAYTPGGAITVDYHYLPTAAMAKANSFTLTQTADATETSDYVTMQANNGHKTYQQGLKTCAFEVKGFYDVSNGFESLLDGRAELIVEICPDGNSKAIARGFFKPTSDQNDGNVGAIETYDVKFTLTVPDDPLMVLPFSWAFNAGGTLNIGVQKAITAWINGTNLLVQYLPDGTTGFSAAACVVTEISLAGAVDGINIFSTTFQISGAITTV